MVPGHLVKLLQFLQPQIPPWNTTSALPSSEDENSGWLIFPFMARESSNYPSKVYKNMPKMTHQSSCQVSTPIHLSVLNCLVSGDPSKNRWGYGYGLSLPHRSESTCKDKCRNTCQNAWQAKFKNLCQKICHMKLQRSCQNTCQICLST